MIAETTDLPTRYTKSVVTDDQGRYVIPDLPIANYQVWVRGYGLVDSPRMRAKPGQILNHTAVQGAGRAVRRALLSGDLLVHDDEDPAGGGFRRRTPIFRRTSRARSGVQRMNNVDCVGCHQLGQESTRTIPAQFGKFNSGADAWIRRVAAGQSGEMMTNRLAGQLGGVPYKYFGEWTDRVAKGEVPKHKPPRPPGVERNLVVTTWDWSTPDKYLHDLISSDRRKPTVNANGPLYGAPEYSTDNMPILDPKTHTVSYFKMPVADPNMPLSLGPGHAGAIKPTQAVGLLGRRNALGHAGPTSTTPCSTTRAASGSPRTCAAWTIRPGARRARSHPSAKVFPIDRSPRQVAMLDPKTHEVRVHRHLLRHAPSAVRLRRRQHAVALRQRAGGGLGQHQGVGRDQGSAEGGRLVPVRARLQRQRQARRVHRAGQAGGRQGHALQSGLRSLRGDAASDRRLGLVHVRRVRRPAGLPALRSEDQAQRVLCACRRRRSACAAATSARTACCGARAPPAISSSSTAASARAPLNGPNATGNHCPEGFDAAQVSGPGLRRCAEFERRGELLHLGRPSQRGRPRRRTFRSRPPTCRTASSASRTAR